MVQIVVELDQRTVTAAGRELAARVLLVSAAGVLLA